MRKEKEKKEKKKGGCLSKVLIVIVVLIVLFVIIGVLSGNNEQSTEESHIYDNAKIVDMMNGSNTEKIGEVSIIEAESSDITIDVLTDWYFNYVEDSDYNYCLIVYTDIKNTGCYAFNGVVMENVALSESDYGLYMLSDDSEATMYTPSDNELIEYTATFTEETETEWNAGELAYLNLSKDEILEIRARYNELEEVYWNNESQWDEYAALTVGEWPDEMIYYYGDGYDEYCDEILNQIAEEYGITTDDAHNIYLYTADWIDVQAE